MWFSPGSDRALCVSGEEGEILEGVTSSWCLDSGCALSKEYTPRPSRLPGDRRASWYGNDRPEVSGPKYAAGLLCHVDISLFSIHPVSNILTYVSLVLASGPLMAGGASLAL